MSVLLTLLNGSQLSAFTSAGHWQERTIFDLVAEHAQETPHKVAVRERHRVTTYEQLIDAATRFASALARAGLRSGDRVAIWLPSRVETVVGLLACSRAGLVVCPSLHRDHTVAEISELVARMRASAIVVQRGYGADAEDDEIVAAVEHLDHVKFVQTLEPADGGPAFPDLRGQPPAVVHADPNSVVYLAFTSGTTGQPKGVMHSDNTLLVPARAMAADWSLTSTSCIYSMSPLSHNLGFGAMLLSATVGAEFVVHDLPRGASLADRLRETEASFAFGVPTHAIDLLTELRSNSGAVRHLRGFRVSGAAIPPSVAQGLLDVGVVPQSGYGMTEAGSHQYTLPDDDPALIVGSSGRACDGYQVAVFSPDDSEKALSAGEIGQIAGRGASLMLGYFDDQQATENSFNAAGWFLTGDLGWIDEEGYLRITGRKKDVIIRGGHNIFPAKIENLAMQHPAIAAAAAVPIADERLGEKVCLVVQTRPSQSVDGVTLLEHLAQAGLSKYDMPEYLAFVSEMPLTPSGKVLKKRLIERISDQDIAATPIRAATHQATAE